MPDPMWQSTRGITIDAVPEAIWPWLAQMGFPAHRGGWYTPHLLDMLTFGIRQRSAEEIVEELQCVEVGDRIPDSADWSVFFTVARGRSASCSRSPFDATCPEADSNDRLQLGVRRPATDRPSVRAGCSFGPAPGTRRAGRRLFAEFVIGPADFVNAGGMLRGIKRRAESQRPVSRTGASADPSRLTRSRPWAPNPCAAPVSSESRAPRFDEDARRDRTGRPPRRLLGVASHRHRRWLRPNGVHFCPRQVTDGGREGDGVALNLSLGHSHRLLTSCP